MGAEALTAGLKDLALEHSSRLPFFTEVVLAAPDVSRDNFIALAKHFKRAGKRVTLYSSSNDKALSKARQVRGFPRAGQAGEHIVVVPGVDTIDVSGVDNSVIGHFYYGSSAPILKDMANIIDRGLPVKDRPGLEEQKRNGLAYWRYRKQEPTRPAGR